MMRYFLKVRFHDAGFDDFTSDEYSYWIDTDKSITVGSYLILKDEASNWDALKVVKVTYAETFQAGKKYEKVKTKGLVGFADVEDYFKAKEAKRRANEIKEKLEARFKEAEKMALYRKLAETDEEMKSLLAELDSLGLPAEDDDKEAKF